ncbi:hypothetical protein LPJ62_001475 [Coemansia sp. RSA 2167]|nr:hypothetical protein LPJ58_000351 [Coemansia sp. RSA 1591]KAJ1791294.1 hypothetical protein LPJ62_001475 [Coemansia sp. RSA 2167]KAJ1794999.1 hypothetical protein LPJ67_000331 [Coemansia sp. RSA 1938]KAJ2147175.1 hypothetical protein IW142_001740 [Coemansia sp. RSA 564]KAJ2182467.1 hypothetical protein GGF45_000811 [Coemansia sp. RSA 551]KAJ2248971.1 hypothetical protein GGH97_001529 [Coemansia sp. RSA 475]KAJ2409052.1 hypothetical protein J3F80_001612 [Coemansia sp. RSA 2526]KAJ2547794.1
MGVLEYAVISTQSLSIVLIIGMVGFVLRPSKRELKVLADINVSVLTPALLFAKISGSLTRSILGLLWFVPVMYVLLGCVGLVWTRYGGQALGLSDGFRRLCSIAVFFSNVNTILIPIMQGIAASPDARFLLRDANDTAQQVADRAIAYGMIIGIMNNILRWSVGVAIMRPAATAAEISPEDNKKTSWLTPPLIAVMCAVAVVVVSPVQKALLAEGTYVHTLWLAIDTCGDACIPLTLLGLGGQLRLQLTPRTDATGPATSASEQKRGVVLVLVGRFLIVPAVSCAALLAIYVYVPGLVPLLRSDPVLFLTLAIVSATPPAINLMTVAQQMGVYEAEAAAILSCAYAVGVLALSVEVSIFLWLASLIHST